MKQLLIFALFLALGIQIQAQCVTKSYYGISVTICNDGEVQGFSVTPNADGYTVNYDPTGVDFNLQGGNPVNINDLDHYRCATCMAPVSAYGYCGSTKGVAVLSWTCQLNPWTYTLWPKGVTHNLQLVTYMGRTPDGAYHYRYKNFMVTDPPTETTTTVTTTTTTTTKKGRSGK